MAEKFTAYTQPKPSQSRRRVVFEYIVALTSVILFAAIRTALDPIFGDVAPLILFLIPVAFSAWFGGFGPGMVAMCTGCILGMTLFVSTGKMPAEGTLLLPHWFLRGFPFFIVGTTLSYLAARLETARSQALTKGEEARNSEEFLLRVMSSTPDCIKVLDLEGHILSINDNGLKLLELDSRETLLNLFWPDLWQGDGKTKAAQAVLDARSGKTVSFVEFSPTPKGTPKWWDSTLSAVPGSDGKPERLLCVTRDVTEQQKTKQALDEALRRLDSALIAGEVATFEWDVIADKVYGDENFARLFKVGQRTEGSASLQDYAEVIHPDDRERIGTLIQSSVTSGDNYEAEYRIVSGTQIQWVNAKGRMVKNESGKVAYFPGVVTNITARKLAEQDREQLIKALAESEAQFRQLADAMPQIVWAAKPDGEVEYFNQRWFDYIGEHPVEIGDANWDRFAHPDDVQATSDAWTSSLQTGEPYKVEFRLRGSDGSYRWFLERALAIRDENNTIARWLGTCTDIQEQKELQAQKESLLQSERAARTAAEHASKVKDEFLATLSHELRTPLNAIYGWTQLLRRKDDAKTIQEGVDVIDRNVRIQTQLINDLLDMSRIISGKLRLNIQPVSLEGSIDAAIETVAPAAEARGVRIEKKIDPHVSVLSIDPSRMQQVVWNLLSNAIKFTPKDGFVTLEVNQKESHVELCVSDSGQGIEADFLPYIFDRFRQADAATNRKHGGLGLGLAIVKQLVELHGGTISASSAGIGSGTAFTISLPLQAVHAESDQTEHVAAPSIAARQNDYRNTNLTGIKILAIDDQRDGRDLLRRLLEDCFANVTVAESANEALTILKSDLPHVIVSDIGMPEIDGYEFMKRLRNLDAHEGGAIPAIALTAFVRKEDKEKAISAGFSAHIGKPIEPGELVSTIASLTKPAESAATI